MEITSRKIQSYPNPMKPIAFPLFASTARGLRASSAIVLTCASLLGSAALSQADVIVSESFDYDDGPLSGKTGGTGWSNHSWFQTSTAVSGGVAGGGGDSSARHNFNASLGATGTVWVRFDWGNSEAPAENNSYGGITFYTGSADLDANQNFLIGNPWTSNPAAAQWNISGGTGDNGTDVSNIGMKSGLAKLDLGAGTISLWVRATGTTIDVSDTADASVSGLDLTNLGGIRINGYSGNGASQSFDNLTIATTMAEVNAIDTPPPTPNSGTWANTAGGTWGTAGNWVDSIEASGSDNTAYFNTLDLTADTTVTLDSTRTIGNLVFGDTDTSSAASWTLTGSNLTLAGTTPPTITVNALGTAKTATISATVAGSAGLTKSGDGTLILTGTSSYSGTTTISGGTLQIGNGGTTGTVGGGAVANDGSFVINRSDDLSISSAITGSGSLTKQGTGTLTLGQYPTNTGDITVSGGKLIVNASWWGQWITNDLHISNGTLEINAPNWNEFRINGGKGVYFDAPGGGILALDNETNFFANNGSLYFSTAGGAQNQITGSGINTDFAWDSTTFNVVGGDDPVSDLKVACGINNSGSITKFGDGILELAANNTYTGNTTVSDGTLLVSASGSLRFRPTTGGQTNALSGSETATLSYLGTLDLDLSATEISNGNFWTLVDVGSFSGPTPTLTPEA
jgi:fibronectin-binding autotransporter adhesin